MQAIIIEVGTNFVVSMEAQDAIKKVLLGTHKFLPDGLVDGATLNEMLFDFYKAKEVPLMPPTPNHPGTITTG